jgi:hypothetical protein
MALPQRAARRQPEDRLAGSIGLAPERAPQHPVHQRLAGAVQEARHASRWQERRGELARRRDRNHPEADRRHAEMLGDAETDEAREPACEEGIAVVGGIVGRHSPGDGVAVDDLRQGLGSAGERALLHDAGDRAVMIHHASDVARQRHARHLQRLGRCERGGVGEQASLMASIDQRAAEEGERARVSFGAIGGDGEPHAA